jgi:hypothetical protein
LNIEQRFTMAYNPGSKGGDEQFNRTINSTMLRKELNDGHRDDWEDFLQEICFAYRS